VPVISKRTIGKLMVKHCGNEGQQDDPTLVVTLRRILQATITKLDTESEETWKNAEIVIYDQQGNDFCIRSGNFVNKFVVQLDEKDEINITCTKRQKRSLASFFTSKPSKRRTKSSKLAAIEDKTTDSAAQIHNSSCILF
jgi:hypothetical protein